MTAHMYNASHNSSPQRGLAMVLALASAVVLSPLYASRNNSETRFYETKWINTGFVLPAVLAGLIIAIKTTSSSSSSSTTSSFSRHSSVLSPDPSWVLRIGSSSWGLAGVLVMLMLVLSWQHSVQDFFWR